MATKSTKPKTTPKPRAPRAKKLIQFPCEVCLKESTYAQACCGSDWAFFCTKHSDVSDKYYYETPLYEPTELIKSANAWKKDQFQLSLSAGKERDLCSRTKDIILYWEKK